MDSSYGASESTESSEPKQSVDQENEDAGEETALISNKILSPEGEPLKEGDEIVLQVVKNYGDESEVKYAPKKGGEDKSKPGEGSSPEEDFAQMDQAGA